MRKLVRLWNRIWTRKDKGEQAFQVLTDRELAAAFGGDPWPLLLDDPNLKPERVQGW